MKTNSLCFRSGANLRKRYIQTKLKLISDMAWLKSETLKLIELLHTQECLWNTKCEDYKDRNKKRDALEYIAREINVSACDVEKKITNLKNQYNRELYKIKSKSGSGIDEVYDSPWYGFEALYFLKSNIKHRPNDNTVFEKENIENDDHSVDPLSTIPEIKILNESGEGMESCSREKKVKISEQNEVLSILRQASESIAKRKGRDEFDVYGEYISTELRGIKSANTLLDLKKHINDLIYNAKKAQLVNESMKNTQLICTLENLS